MVYESQEEPINPPLITSVFPYCWMKGVLRVTYLHLNQETPEALDTSKAIQKLKEDYETSRSSRGILQVGSPKQQLQQVEQQKQQQDKMVSSGITKVYKPQDKIHILPGSLISGNSECLWSHGYNQNPAVFSIQLVVIGYGGEAPHNNANISHHLLNVRDVKVAMNMTEVALKCKYYDSKIAD